MTTAGLARDLLAREMLALIASAREGARRVAASEATDGGADTHDKEAVHDFRVSLRRLRTLLGVARAVWGKKRLARFRDELRCYARATGVLRDEEVLVETLGGIDLPESARGAVNAWLEARAPEARARRSEAVVLLREGPPRRVKAGEHGKRVRLLDRSLERLGERLQFSRAHEVPADALGLEAIAKTARDVLSLAASDPEDAAAMHALRIRFKRMRYTAELFADLLGDEIAELAKHAAKMQKRLGELHDLDEAIGRIREAEGIEVQAREATVAALVAARAAVAQKARADLERLEPVLQRARARGDGDDGKVVGTQTTA
ncbi:CHAD domain-containing protein [Polyangium aurulentum]|uniref:CHAD domain-containing protein n=1 Tax=Polyangium aurulentum TaxID=2567896 RepID=UPI0010AEA67E|nr:CHAD domain-containing protein [Polyangium aurulentum]UQA62478.1 CHAD domain-containing protein [Polyangium aurulentum]